MDIRVERMHMYDLRPLIPTVGYTFGGHMHWHGELTVFVLWLKWGFELRFRSSGAPAADKTIMDLFDQVIRGRVQKTLPDPSPQRASH
jgi:hypothetical protein